MLMCNITVLQQSEVLLFWHIHSIMCPLVLVVPSCYMYTLVSSWHHIYMHGVKFLFVCLEETNFNLNHGLFSKLTLVFQARPCTARENYNYEIK